MKRVKSARMPAFKHLDEVRPPDVAMTSPRWSPSPLMARWLIGAALLPFILIVVVRWSHPPSGGDGDYAQYLLHAKAIAESRPYTDIGYIYSELNLVGPKAQPPGWPLVLAPFVALFGTDWMPFKVLVTLLVAASAVTAGLYFLRRDKPVAAFAATAAMPVALESQYATSSALSDPLFCLLLWFTLLLADTTGPMRLRNWVALASLAVGVVLVRVAGVAMLPAIVLHAWLLYPEKRSKLVPPLIVLLAILAIVGWLSFDSIPFSDHLVENWPVGSIKRFARAYDLALAEGALYPFGLNLADDIYHLMIALPMLIGGVMFFRTQYRSALACFTVFYLGVLMLSPVQELRYAWPVIPLVFVFIVEGFGWLGDRFTSARLRYAMPKLLLGFVAAVSLAASVHIARMPRRWSLLDDPDSIALFDWVRTTRDSAMRVVFANPRVLTLETSVPAMGIPYGDEAVVLAELDRNRITHVVVPLATSDRTSENDLHRLVVERSEYFPTAFANGTYDVRRFVLRPPTSPPDSGSLAAAPPQ